MKLLFVTLLTLGVLFLLWMKLYIDIFTFFAHTLYGCSCPFSVKWKAALLLFFSPLLKSSESCQCWLLSMFAWHFCLLVCFLWWALFKEKEQTWRMRFSFLASISYTCMWAQRIISKGASEIWAIKARKWFFLHDRHADHTKKSLPKFTHRLSMSACENFSRLSQKNKRLLRDQQLIKGKLLTRQLSKGK